MKSIDSLQGQLNKVAGTTAAYTAHKFYVQGVNAAQGIVNGLNASEKKVNSAIAKLAAAMVNTFRHGLGIASPSKLARRDTRFVGGGHVLGLLDRIPQAKLAAKKLALASLPPLDLPAVKRSGAASPSGSSGGDRNPPAVHVHLPQKMILRVGDKDFDAHMENITGGVAAGALNAISVRLDIGVRL